ncbi:MAG: CDP-paratose 2-epimerase [Phycisphaerae bacterium]|nr:CDP-paratose 2-epimerase [Phycisphaerae bacterium]
MTSQTDPTVTIRRNPQASGWIVEASQWLPATINDVWPFFTDARNLEAITPDTLSFNVITPGTIEMRRGALIDYKLRIRGVPVYWRTEIAAWEPGVRFVDRQIRGPYKRWEHEHTFEPEGAGTRCRDRVLYDVPGGPLAPIVNALIVQRDVDRIFRFRCEKLAARFDGRVA